jgi:DNA-binding XRE family transcriptional regulator
VSTTAIDWDQLLNVRRVRDELGLSQSQFADLAGVSSRAIQSCEQGWRKPSSSLERTLLLLLLAHRNGPEFENLDCWDVRDCPAELRDGCLVFWCRQGHVCWLLSGNKCEGRPMRTWSDKKKACGRCDVMRRLVGGRRG